MFKITFADQTTASLFKLKGNYTLAQPALTEEAHAALCLFLPEAKEAILPLTEDAEGKLGVLVSTTNQPMLNKAISTPSQGRLARARSENQRYPTEQVMLLSGNFKTCIGEIVEMSSTTSAKIKVIGNQGLETIDYPTAHTVHLVKAGDLVLVPVEQGFYMTTVIKVSDSHVDTINAQGEKLTYTIYAVIPVVPTTYRKQLLNLAQQGDTLRVLGGLYSKRRLGECVTFDRWDDFNRTYAVTKAGDLVAAQDLQWATIRKQAYPNVKTQPTFTIGDEVIIRLPDNSVTHSKVLDVGLSAIKCKWSSDFAYFTFDQVIKVKPEGTRRIELEDIQKGAKLIVVVGKDVHSDTVRKDKQLLLLGDIVTFDCWEPWNGQMAVKLAGAANRHPASLFQLME
jgi:hypothetical protein